MESKQTTNTKQKDYTFAWMLIAITGLLWFIFSAIVGAQFKIDFLSKNAFFGWSLMAFPLLVFQFNLFAGKSDLKIELSDLKTFPFWLISFMLLAVDAFFFAGIDLTFGIIPGFNVADSLVASGYLKLSWPYISGIFVFILVLALAYRLVNKTRSLILSII